MKSKKVINTVDKYIEIFPKDVQNILEKIRRTIRKTVPDAVEKISYDIPAFNLNGKYLIYFAAWKNHIAVYPIPAGTEAFEKEISPFIAGKGTLRFPLDKPIPYDLVKKIVIFRKKNISLPVDRKRK